jgi:hypothetical protein
MNMLRSALFFWILVFTFSIPAISQELSFSAPQKITAGYARVQILGKNSQGILIRQLGRSDDQIAAYYDNLQLRWKKVTPHKEKNAKLEEIVVYQDSVLFLYTILNKGATLLKAFKTNPKLESLFNPVVIDTINRSAVNPTPELYFAYTTDKSKIMVYYEDAGFRSNKLLTATCFDFRMRNLWKSSVKVNNMEEADILEGVIDNDGNACIATGDNTAKSYNNNFPYTSLHVFTMREMGRNTDECIIDETNYLFTECKVRLDMNTGEVLMAGLYANGAGNESDGVYFFKIRTTNDSILLKRFEPHSVEFLSQLTGNNPPKKNDGFYDFQPKELIVKRDGGAILVTESESVSSESYTSNNYGAFGLTSGFTVNYYHFDDIAIFSFLPDGSLDWKQVLHKKQATEGDGGYYSSYIMVIGTSMLQFIYNDVINGQTSVADFMIDATGKQQRSDVFNADRKGVMVIPRSSKQISPNELIMPSLKRNYLQFVKVSF